MRFVSVVNRSPKTLKYTWLGKHNELKPGKHNLPEQDALAARYQNPIRGSEDDFGNLQSYIGIEDEPYNDPVDPVDESKELELFNLKQYRNAQPVMVIQGRGFSTEGRASGGGLPVDGAGVSGSGTDRGSVYGNPFTK